MNIEKMIEEWETQKFTNTYHQLDDEIEQINKLCDYAKKILFIERAEGNIHFNDLGLLRALKYSSPIEQIFYLTWVIYKTQSNYFEYVKIRISPQEEIDIAEHKYKVDFLFPSYLRNGEQVPFENPIIVECDGYDSHSSKQQRNYDTNRENELKMAGYSVIRFTGTQIYTEPYKCVIQTAKFIYDRNKAQLEKAKEEFYNG